MSNNLISLRRLFYQLKRDYGYEGALYRVTPGTTDLETGAKNITRVKYTIDRMVVLGFKAESLGFYGSALMKAGREFSYGGFQDQDLKRIIIDGEDLPVDFEVQQDDYVVYQHKKFEIVKITKLEENLGYELLVNYLKGSVTNEVHEAFVFQSLRLTQTLSEELV